MSRPTRSADKRELAISRVLAEVQRGLIKIQEQVKELGMPPLKEVTLTLQTEVVSKVEGKIKVLIFSFGKTWQRERSQQVVLTLTPPGAAVAPHLRERVSLADQLVDAVVSAARGVQESRRGEPPLEFSGLTAEFSFVVVEGTGVGVEFEIVPVSGELKGELTKKALHKIQLAFEKPK